MDAAWKSGPPVPMVFVNPEIISCGAALTEGEERCLSIPGRGIIVTRHAALTLRWQGLDGVAHERPFEGQEAQIIQHEMDHLDGILTLHRAGELER
jgi:peptide deformylase